jgi:SH3-like domain-containing protein
MKFVKVRTVGLHLGFSLILVAAISSETFAAAAPPGGDPVCAKSFMTLHKGPSSKDPISWRAAKYMPFLRLESKNSWVKLQDLDGETHWAPSREVTSNLSCVVVRTQVATLRKNPSTTAEPTDIKTVDKFTPFKKLELDGEWVKVEDESGRQGWIHQSNLWRPVKLQSMTF